MSDKVREERRKAALRENLKKRKAQARQRSAGEAEESGAPSPDSGGAATAGDKPET
ncbi:MAG TPA: hypothetical protein VLQ65_03425 [Saliniramus sp.]|nr:hypothetical protein [Saliniramus sp.]